MIYALFVLLAFGVPWAAPRLFPNAMAVVGIAINLLAVIILMSVAGEVDAFPYQIAAMGMVIGGALTCWRWSAARRLTNN